MKQVGRVSALVAALISIQQASAAAPVPTEALVPAERLEKNRAYQAAAPDPDRNGDGRISFEEWLDKEWRFLLSYDTDGDQRLSMAEYIAVFCVSVPGRREDTAYAACEKTKRGDFGEAVREPSFKITRQVYSPVARRSFSYNDKNGDGYLSPEDNPGR
jgi:hypothetical protein